MYFAGLLEADEVWWEFEQHPFTTSTGIYNVDFSTIWGYIEVKSLWTIQEHPIQAARQYNKICELRGQGEWIAYLDADTIKQEMQALGYKIRHHYSERDSRDVVTVEVHGPKKKRTLEEELDYADL